MSKKIKCSEDEQKALLVCVTELEKDDQFIREKNIKTWKKAEEYWRLNQFLYWDEVALDYRSLEAVGSGNDDDNEDLPPKTFGIYRAYGESLIAAMASGIPTTLFFPDDTSNPDDITASKGYSLVAELIQKHNQSPLLFIKALTTLFNQGLVASHTYWDEDESYGTKKVNKYKNEKRQLTELNCPQCGTLLGHSSKDIEEEDEEDSSKEKSSPELNEDEQEQVAKPDYQHDLKSYKCDKCGYEGQPEIGKVFDEVIPRLVGETDAPKGRVKIDMYGPLNVRINSYAKEQKDVGMLELQIEMHSAAARDEFEDIADQINSTSDFYSYERWGRTSSELLADTMFNQVTVRYCWLRPWAFQAYGKGAEKQAIIKELKKKFPHGCCAIFVNDVFAEAYDEALDDHWTLSYNPLDSWLHALPLGKTLLDTQDAFNETENLGLQKQSFGLAETFVSTDLIEENAYRSQRAGPGYVTFVKPLQNEPIGNKVYQSKTTTMSAEDLENSGHFNTLGQFLSGAVPSMFGGNQTTGSKTASEYRQSRAYALQRQNNPWTVIKYFWSNTIGKSSRLFVTEMEEDEKFTRKNGNAFETVWIKKAEVSGKIGNVEPDISEQFPVSWADKRDLLVQLITLQNPVIGEIMLHPNNAQNVKDALGFPDFYVPGEQDRTKQLIEVRQLINVASDDKEQNFFPPDSIQSTVSPDIDADDDNVHIQVIKLWLVGPEGLFTKETNPAAYLNCILHKREHEQNLAKKTTGVSDNTNPGQKPETKTV